MPLILSLRTHDNQITAYVGDELIAEPTPIASLPTLAFPDDDPSKLAPLQKNPYLLGQALGLALGGEALLARVQTEPDRLLLLHADEPAQALPWEYATLPGTRYLACEVGFLRLVEREAAPLTRPGPLQFVALTADPLVGPEGENKSLYDLDVHGEMKAIRQVLRQSDKILQAQRIPPTEKALRQTVKNGPALLHLSCHGDVQQTAAGPLALLHLENDTGQADLLRGDQLVSRLMPGVVRLVVLSACKSADGQASLAQALVWNGVPAAIGMQALFPDHLSDDLAATLYGSLLAEHNLGEALRQARLSLQQQDPRMAGLPVGYVTHEGWQPLPLQAGRPQIRQFTLPGRTYLPPEVQPPRPLLGRHRDLYGVARLYDEQGRGVVTVVGTGGMGKTALASAFAERFAWRWPDGVVGVTFASGVPDGALFRASLWGGLHGGDDPAFAALPVPEQERRLLATLRDWDGLLLLDNYETIMQEVKAGQAEADRIHKLVGQMANGGQPLLLTSREQPTQLANERLYPPQSGLGGLDLFPAVQLFLRHSTRANRAVPGHLPLARKVAELTAGHPLAVALLAGEFDISDVAPAHFLDHWEAELAAARRDGLVGHHVTFATAFNRSYDRLTPSQQHRLHLLTAFPFPFFAEAAALVWNLPTDTATMPQVRGFLGELTRLSLLEVDGTFAGTDQPATYRFQPALYQEVARRVTEAERPQQTRGYAVYGAWLARRGYGEIGSDVALNRLVFRSLAALEAATEALEGVDKLWHGRRLAWILNFYGQVGPAYALLHDLLPPESPLPDPALDRPLAEVGSSLRYQLADIEVTRGDLDRALRLYEESLELLEQLGDKKGKAASLHQMAQVFLTRGDLDRALRLYEESLELKEQLGDKQGKAASLHQMAQVFLTRGDLDRALRLYEESLELLEQLGDKQGKAASLHAMAQVFLTRGDLDRALRLYEESLELKEQLGDKQGKAASLHQMAQVFLTRGDLDRALRLYEESLELKEQLGDKQGKAASLHQMAQVFLTRGDLDRALRLYEESLELKEQLGDKKGKAASLHNLANIFMNQGDWEKAESLLLEGLSLVNELGHLEGVAFHQLRLGQIAQVRGDQNRALSLYRQALAHFQSLGMPVAQQVLRMIADLETPSSGDVEATLAQLSPEQRAAWEAKARVAQEMHSLVQQARAADERGDAAAVTYQEQAVALARQLGDSREALVQLSVLLYNLAGYYQKAGRHTEAVTALEEVVALDEVTEHPDLASDRQALAQARERAAQAEQLAQLSPAERAELEAAARQMAEQLATLTPEQRQALEQQAALDNLANQVTGAAQAVQSGQLPAQVLLEQLLPVAQQVAHDEQLGAGRQELVALFQAITGLLQGEPPLAGVVQGRYAGHWAALLGE